MDSGEDEEERKKNVGGGKIRLAMPNLLQPIWNDGKNVLFTKILHAYIIFRTN